MKKITTIFKTMLLAVVVLVLAQGCIPNTPGVNPAPILTGKIKSSVITASANNIACYYSFIYDDSGKLVTLKIRSDLAGQTDSVNYDIIYQTDKLTVKDSKGLTAMVFYLKTNTNLIDSFEQFNIYGQRSLTTIKRDSSNNLTKISIGDSYINDFVYENGNIKSYYSYISQLSFPSTTNRTFSYDSTKVTKAGTNIYGIPSLPFISSNSFLFFDVAYLDLSLGNTFTKAVSSISWESPYGSFGSVNYNYTNYTSTNTTINMTGYIELSLNWDAVINTYY
jgi:hypothetical protein